MAFLLCGAHAKGGTVRDDFIYVAINLHWQAHWFELPQLPPEQGWFVFANTGADPSSWAPGSEPRLENQGGLLLGERSVVILVGR